MPRRDDIHKILLIGSGPIVIGQAAEFDYSGVQACKVLLEEGYEVVGEELVEPRAELGEAARAPQAPEFPDELDVAHRWAAISRKRSNRWRASCGPGPASGWYWTAAPGTSFSARPSTVRS